MAVSTDAWWRRGAWPALGRSRPAATPVLAVAALLLLIEVVELAGQACGTVVYARETNIAPVIGGQHPPAGFVLVRAAADMGPVDALIVLAAAMVLGCVRPGGLDRRQRQARRVVWSVTVALALLLLAAVVAPFYELGASSAHVDISPIEANFVDNGRMICDRIACGLMLLTALAVLIGEWQARRITEGRIHRGEG